MSFEKGSKGIEFVGDDKMDVTEGESTAEARSAKVGSDGPIESPVEDMGSTMMTSDQQEYPQPNTGEKGEVEFVDTDYTTM